MAKRRGLGGLDRSGPTRASAQIVSTGVIVSMWYRRLPRSRWWRGQGITGSIDGRPCFHDTDPAVQPGGSRGLIIQLDAFLPGRPHPASMDVDRAPVHPSPW